MARFGAPLDLAEDERTPAAGTGQFLAIFSEGLDEFFQVRVAGLKDQWDAGLRARSADGLRPSETLRAIGARVSELVARQSHIFVDEIAPELAAAGIRLSDWSSLDIDWITAAIMVKSLNRPSKNTSEIYAKGNRRG